MIGEFLNTQEMKVKTGRHMNQIRVGLIADQVLRERKKITLI